MTTDMVPNHILDPFVDACQAVARRGLMQCSSGNMSWRLDDRHLLVTASRSWMERLGPADVTVCRIADGAVVRGRPPTVEIAFHAGILHTRPEVGVVMHFQTPMATALACRAPGPVNYFVIPEIPFYIGPVATIPYHLPGSPALADAVVAAMAGHDLVVMGNHGQVTVGRDVDHAIQNAVFFEMACGILVHCGDDTRPLDPAAVAELLALRAETAQTGA